MKLFPQVVRRIHQTHGSVIGPHNSEALEYGSANRESGPWKIVETERYNRATTSQWHTARVDE